MIVTIIQPAYLPWLGFFERIKLSDLYIVLDHVQMDGNSKTNFINRNKIRTQTDFTWLTIPLKKKGNFGNLFINSIEIDNTSKWKHKHWNSIKQYYSKTPFFKQHIPFLEEFYSSDHERIIDIINHLNRYLFQQLAITTPVMYSSEIKDIDSVKDQLILDLCLKVGATSYISGPFGRDYLNKESFEKNKINLLFHDYRHPEYKQQYEGFIPYMSIIDLLFTQGDQSMEILNTTKTIDELSK